MKKPKREILGVTVCYQFPATEFWASYMQSKTFHVRVSNNAQEYRENVTRCRREALEYGLVFERLGAAVEIDDIREVLPEDVQEAQQKWAATPPEVMAEQVALADEVIAEILEEEREQVGEKCLCKPGYEVCIKCVGNHRKDILREDVSDWDFDPPPPPRTDGALAELRTLGQNLINAIRDDRVEDSNASARGIEDAIQALAHALATNPGIGWSSPEETNRLRKVIHEADRVLGGRKSFKDIQSYKKVRKKNYYGGRDEA